MKKIRFVLAGGALAATMGAAAVGLSTPVLSAEVTLRGANCFPGGSPPGKPFDNLIKKINDAGKGVIQVRMLGGAPAIGSPFEMTRRLSRGAFDIVGCPDSYFGNVMVEAGAIKLMPVDIATARKNGAWAYFDKLLNAKGVKLLSQAYNFGPQFLFLSKPITKPDLKGLHLRVAPVHTPFFTALGATVQRSNFAQVYTYMENGTVVGFGWPILALNPGWTKVTKYWVEPGFYRAGIQVLMNLKKYNSLTKAQRDVLNKVALEHEASTEKWPEQMAKRKTWLASQGLKPIKFSADGAKKWSKTALDTAWADVLKKSPKHGTALRKLFGQDK